MNLDHSGQECKPSVTSVASKATLLRFARVGSLLDVYSLLLDVDVCGRCRRIRQVGTGHRYEETDRDEVGAFAHNIDKASKPIRVQLSISGKPVTMKLDTRTAVSVPPSDSCSQGSHQDLRTWF